MWPDSPALEIIRQGDQREGWVWFILQDNHKYCSNLGGSYELSLTSSQSPPLIDYGSITSSQSGGSSGNWELVYARKLGFCYKRLG